MRKQGSMVQTRIPILGRVWLTTNQSATVQVLKNSENFPVTRKDGKVAGLQWWMPSTLTRLSKNMLAKDEPEHSRLRGIVDTAFHRGSITRMGPVVERLADKHARDLFSQGPTADLIARLARPFPLAVICGLLGLPKEDESKFMSWAQSLTNASGILSFLLMVWRIRPLTQYIEDRIDHERIHGGSGLLHDLLTQDTGEARLDDEELLAMVFLLLLAGHETTTHLISGGLLALLNHRESFEHLQENPQATDLAVEECLRFASPVMTTKPRFVKRDCEIDGTALKAGEIIMPLLVAANFDPDVFDDPGRFDIFRKPNRHLEFGTGIHFCLGHQLARREMKEALLSLVRHHPDLRLAVHSDDISWNTRFGLRSLKSLPVTSSLP